MATVRKTFVYDPLQDSDIHEWINSIKTRERSKYIRIVIRSLLRDGSQHTIDEPINSNNTERIHFTYDDLEDRDIHLWFQNLPQRGQSDYIKKAIRTFLAGDSKVPKARTTPLVVADENTKHVDENIKPTKHNVEEKEEQSDDYVDLNNDFLDNIGK